MQFLRILFAAATAFALSGAPDDARAQAQLENLDRDKNGYLDAEELPEALADSELGEFALPLDIGFGHQVRLLAYDFASTTPPGAAVSPSGPSRQ